MREIKFGNKKYKIRTIDIRGYGEVNIGSVYLNSALMNSRGNYKSEESRQLDEQIFYFIEAPLFRLSDSELKKRLESIL